MAVSNFLGLDLAGCPVPSATEPLVTQAGAAYHASLSSILNWILEGKIHAYENNRGQGKVSQATFRRIYEDGICPDVVGECTFGYVQTENGKQLCLNNWHSRAKAFLARLKDNRISNKELKTLVAVRVQSEFIPSYQKMNAPGSAHRTQDKICNPDLAYGYYIKPVFEQVGSDVVSLIGSNKWTVISAILYNLGRNKVPTWYWPKVYHLRGEARQVADWLAGEFKVSNAKVNSFVEALDYWYKFMLQIQAKNAVSLNIKKITKSAGFFGYIVADRVGPKEFHESMKVCANRVFSHYDKIRNSLPELTRGNDDSLTKFTADLDKIFKNK